MLCPKGEGLMLLLKNRMRSSTADSYRRRLNSAHPSAILSGAAKSVLYRLQVESEAREVSH